MNSPESDAVRGNQSSISAVFGPSVDDKTQSPAVRKHAFEELLTIPIENAINQLPSKIADELRRLALREHVPSLTRDSGITSFGNLFAHTKPPEAMLRFAKDFGKLAAAHGSTRWPEEIYQSVYYVSIAGAMARLNKKITALDDEAILRGLEWMRQQDWIDSDTAGRIGEAIDWVKMRIAGQSRSGS